MARPGQNPTAYPVSEGQFDGLLGDLGVLVVHSFSGSGSDSGPGTGPDTG